MNPEKIIVTGRHARLAREYTGDTNFLDSGGQERPRVKINGALRGVSAGWDSVKRLQ
tara:strand:+ start:3161 stop:3331 length:171 start_codon:yes stop_codon:yes gene_type:complete